MSELSSHYYSFLQRLDPGADPWALRAGELAVHFTQHGNSCVSLHTLAGKSPATLLEKEGGRSEAVFPEAAALDTLLRQTRFVGKPGDFRPLILDEAQRLYLYRYWQYEQRLAEELRRRAAMEGYEPQEIAPHLGQLFSGKTEKQVDWQQVAVVVAALKKLAFISGGPGTGKTFTVVKIIALLQLLARGEIAIGLAAPTGKAASRLQESIKNAGASPELPAALGSFVASLEAKTIHRLLGSTRHSPSFRHNRQHKLHLDVLIVDEVSMVDLALMTKLVEAMPENGRLILLGDKDQLSSVEAGRVLADICQGGHTVFSAPFAERLAQAGAQLGADAAASVRSSMSDCQVFLTHSYRFSQESSIGQLAGAVLAGKVDLVRECFAVENEAILYPEIDWKRAAGESYAALVRSVVEGYRPFLQESDPQKALQAFGRFQVLCAHRRGPCGVEALNQWIEARLAKEGLIGQAGGWYGGRPIMVTGNHYALGLFNGDIGITLPDAAGGLRIFFSRPDGSLFSISPVRAPAHETAFALTVHKSQGSEFDHVALILPEKESRLVRRELLYTAITRAKKNFSLWGSAAVLESAVQSVIERSTGLADLLG